jgi:hypothetical protein
MRRARAALLLVPAVALAAVGAAGGCGNGKGDSAAGRLTRVARASGARLRAQAGFQPPADGLLTDGQIDRYVKVRRAAKGRSDEDTARAVAVDPDEFVWVRSRVIEALLEADRRRVRAASDEVYAKTIASLRETRRAVHDAATGRSLDEQIAGLERERATLHKPEPVPSPVAANSRKVAARRSELDPKP